MTTTTEKILTAIEEIHNTAVQANEKGLNPDDVETISQAVTAAVTSLTTVYRISTDSIECPGCQLDLLEGLRLHLLGCIEIAESDMAYIAEENDFEQPEIILEPDTQLLH